MKKKRSEATYVQGANPAAMKARLELRRSGAAGLHARGTNRERTRSDAERKEIDRSLRNE